MAINAPVNDDFKNADQASQPCIHGAFKNVDLAIQPCIHGAINKYVDQAIQPCMRYYKILDLIVSPRPSPKQPKLLVAVEGPSRAPALLRWQAAAGTLRFPSPVSLL